MDIAVLLKVVPDTYATPRISDEGKVVWADNIEWVRDRYSEFAVEEGIKVKEQHGGEVISYTITRVDDKKPVRKALATGVDKAVVIENEELFLSDPVSVAKALAEEIKEQNPDIIFAGKLSSDQNNQLVGPLVGAFLDIPVLTEIQELEVHEDGVTASRKVSNRKETYNVKFPVLITTEKGLNEPRYPKLPDIMKAKRKPTDWKNEAKTGISGKIRKIKEDIPKEDETEGIIFKDQEIPEMVKQLLTHLIDEEKVL